jgi:translation initiation factor eIF-2B subunit gamma
LSRGKFSIQTSVANFYSDITLITPPSSAPAITTALKTNPHLTGLPLPKPDLLAPKGLDNTTGTAEIFRLPEVRDAVKGDFIVLPCDLVCELGGDALLEAWMVTQASLGGSTPNSNGLRRPKMALNGEKAGRRGGMTVCYETRGETLIKGEETDFLATTPLKAGPVPPPKSSVLSQLSNLVLSMPTDTLKDVTEKSGTLSIRHSLLDAHHRVRILGSHRDAHMYIFPAWVLDMINKNERMDSIGEDVIGWWAKAGWQDGLGEKLGLQEIFNDASPAAHDENLLDNPTTHDESDFSTLSSTWTSNLRKSLPEKPKLIVPPILTYQHPTPTPLIRRVDTAPLLLYVSLQLAKLDPLESTSPFTHPKKVAYPEGIASRTTVTRPDCLLAENVTVEERCSLKECVVGANCQIRAGAKLTRCVLMDGIVVGKGCKLTGCVVGKHAEIGEECNLVDCEVQDHLLVEAGSEEKGAKLMSSHGMEATEEELAGGDED